jgi:hypothetical protein
MRVAKRAGIDAHPSPQLLTHAFADEIARTVVVSDIWTVVLRAFKKPHDSPKGDGRNRTGVDGFAGRCVATPPRRQASLKPTGGVAQAVFALLGLRTQGD